VNVKIAKIATVTADASLSLVPTRWLASATSGSLARNVKSTSRVTQAHVNLQIPLIMNEKQLIFLVVMIVVLAVGIFLILLAAAIIVVCCLRSRRAKGSISGGPSFLRSAFWLWFNNKYNLIATILRNRYRGPSVPTTGTLDRAAMIRGDTSSESSGNDNFAVSFHNIGTNGRIGKCIIFLRAFNSRVQARWMAKHEVLLQQEQQLFKATDLTAIRWSSHEPSTSTARLT